MGGVTKVALGPNWRHTTKLFYVDMAAEDKRRWDYHCFLNFVPMGCREVHIRHALQRAGTTPVVACCCQTCRIS